MKLNTINHPKFLRLRKLLNKPVYQCAGVLGMLWQLAAMFADDGDLTKFAPSDIAGFLDYEGDAEELLRSLIDSGWLDNVDGRLVVHDWSDHCPEFIADRLRKRAERASGAVRARPELSETVRECPEVSAEIRISQAKPSQAKPSLNSKLASLPAAEWLSFAEEEANEIVRNANKLSKQLRSVDRDWIWRVCWVAFAVDRGWISDVADRIREKSVAKPQRYIEGALRREIEQRGYSLSECFAVVPPAPPVKVA